MNCPICFEDTDDIYTIACRSNTPHQICNTCEIALRLNAPPTNQGRFIQCPLCRAVEHVQGKRTIRSYEAELKRLYAYAPPPVRRPPRPVPVPAPVPAPAPAPRPGPQWCQSTLRNAGLCTTKGKTKRFCSTPTCMNKVCRKCKKCFIH